MAILTGQSLLHRFRQLLDESKAADIAVAWATHGSAVEELRPFCTRGGKLRIVVGTDQNVTNPDTLRDIHRFAQLRVASPPGHGIFHPKYYCFHRSSRSTVWIGSANLTGSGFGANNELMLEANGSKDAMEWFEKLWSSLPENPIKQIRDYEKSWSPPAFPSGQATGRRSRNTTAKAQPDGLDPSWSWDDFVDNLRAKDQEMRDATRDGVERSVFGDYRSWLYTIRSGRAVTQLRSWRHLERSQTEVLLGRDWGALGSLRGAGKACSIMVGNAKSDKDVRNDILKWLRATTDDGADVIGMGVKAVEAITRHDRIGVGVATRFLALARPDSYVSLNGASFEGLARYSGLGDITLPTLSRHYRKVLERVHSSKWYAAARPKDPLEAEIWDYRAALVDVFVYDLA